ncbi:MAG TPA: DEDD exonuclease domain-containing protein [Dermatophilaceae bacterium]|nr:DEDD exonuclease domain-containing protein [Dermatophilaceae bacterium]
MHAGQAIQATFDDLGTPLHDVTFVVVDLETTGGSAGECAITEVGAVKVRGGEVLGELQTLVNPGTAIPAFIQVLTGITDGMVATAPRIDTVLPAFLEFARGSVLVAHNAGFDVTFLRAAAAQTGHPWPGFQVVDTVTLARQVVGSDEVQNRRLGTLAAHFGARTTPDHRALHDARATVDVLHALLGRVGNLGVHTLEELQSYTSRVTPAQRRKRFLADPLPAAPGVYVFLDGRGRPLYVGTSRNIRSRARSYFTASEQRTRMAEMVGLAESIRPIVCQTTLEAQVRELRLIAEHKPRYNRRSTRPERTVWVKLTVEPFPRLSVVREARDDGAAYAGPYSSRAAADAAVAAIHEVLPLRQCTTRLSASPRGSACALAEMGRCGAPCEGRESRTEYAAHATAATRLLTGDGRELVAAIRERMRILARDQRFEEAAALRDRLAQLLRGAARVQRMAPLAASPEVVAARRAEAGGWELVCVRHGRLAGTSVSPRGADPMPFVDTLRATAEVVTPGAGPAPAAYVEETDLVLRWLAQPGVRIVSLDGEWTCPVGGAEPARAALQAQLDAEQPAVPVVANRLTG